ncbi:OmpA family protein [uncultured Roseobacter sp.]|uniref:OmpA family protein n=1 Tax=uncultured Roseobacter sp. TaxID=114847 RepID=UPI002630AA1D|nr:OmpA family protein [uncultured Roseobacter sp.]
MTVSFSKTGGGLAAAVLGAAFALQAGAVAAQSDSQQGLDRGQYVPSIWVDPDGCEHWVMDDGAEGFMTPHVTRQGIPVCREATVCALVRSDQFFATDSASISAEGRASLRDFFQSTDALAFIITGHTDSDASDAYNQRLSLARANTVADIARAEGAAVSEVRGLGERNPIASNATAEGKARNRRVEITCIK